MEIKEIEIPVPWGFVRGQIFGETKNRTPILCLHGFLDNSNSFKPIAPYLCESNEYYIIALDLPGHGRSSSIPLGAIYTPKLFLTSLRRCVLFLHISSFIFLSHSYGVGQSLLVNSLHIFLFMALLYFEFINSMRQHLKTKSWLLLVWIICLLIKIT
jgi:pimeloyl-ACP methyl ester carboxylesterase